MRPLCDYPDAWGSKRVSIFPHVGPADYTPMAPVAGTVPVVGGDTVRVAEAGMKYFDYVTDGVTDDGVFAVEAVPISVSGVPASPTQLQPGAASTSFRLRWIARVTAAIGGQNQTAGTEAVAHTNLSTFVVRLQAFGPK